MEENKLNTSQEVFSKSQMKAIATVVGDRGGLVEEVLKNHVYVPQLGNVVGPYNFELSDKK